MCLYTCIHYIILSTSPQRRVRKPLITRKAVCQVFSTSARVQESMAYIMAVPTRAALQISMRFSR